MLHFHKQGALLFSLLVLFFDQTEGFRRHRSDSDRHDLVIGNTNGVVEVLGNKPTSTGRGDNGDNKQDEEDSPQHQSATARRRTDVGVGGSPPASSGKAAEKRWTSEDHHRSSDKKPFSSQKGSDEKEKPKRTVASHKEIERHTVASKRAVRQGAAASKRFLGSRGKGTTSTTEQEDLLTELETDGYPLLRPAEEILSLVFLVGFAIFLTMAWFLWRWYVLAGRQRFQEKDKSGNDALKEGPSVDLCQTSLTHQKKVRWLHELFERSAIEYGGRPCFRMAGADLTLTFDQFARRADGIKLLLLGRMGSLPAVRPTCELIEGEREMRSPSISSHAGRMGSNFCCWVGWGRYPPSARRAN